MHRCLMAALMAIKGGLVTYGNLIRSSTPIDFNCNSVYSKGDLSISGSLYCSNFENSAVEYNL
jgi:hypothetical protein